MQKQIFSSFGDLAFLASVEGGSLINQGQPPLPPFGKTFLSYQMFWATSPHAPGFGFGKMFRLEVFGSLLGRCPTI